VRVQPSYVCGLDLGQVADYSAVAALERTTRPDGKNAYAVVGLHRYERGTPYTSPLPESPGIGERVRFLLRTPPLPGCTLAVDQTGVGRAVVDVLRGLSLPATLVPVTITSGQAVSQADNGDWHVAKVQLVGILQVLLQSERLEIREGLRLRETLVSEFGEFKVRVTATANETFGAWREGQHDDLVLAVALACWVGEKFPAFTRESIGRGAKRPAPPRGETLGGDFRHWPRGV
jgi:hypothetical protein